MQTATTEEQVFNIELLASLVAGLDEQNLDIVDAVEGLTAKIFSDEWSSPSKESHLNEILSAFRRLNMNSTQFEIEYKRICDLVDALQEEFSISETGDIFSDAEYEYSFHSDEYDMSRDEMESVFRFFQEQQKFLLQDFEVSVLNLEKGDAAAFDKIRRYIHTLKGEAGALDLSNLYEFVHKLETSLPKNLKSVSKNHIEVLLTLKDYLKKYIGAISFERPHPPDSEVINYILTSLNKDSEESIEFFSVETFHEESPQIHIDIENPEITEFLIEAPEYLHIAEIALLEQEKKPGDRHTINEIFRGFHNLKGISGFLGLKDIEKLSHSAENLIDKVREGKIECSGNYAAAAFDALDMLKEMVKRVGLAVEGKGYECPRGFEELNDRLNGDGESFLAATMEAPRSGISKYEQNSEAAVTNGTVKINTTKLDNLIDTVGELVIANSIVVQEEEFQNIQNHRIAKNLSRLAKITRELQEQTMGLRMISLSGTFQKMGRIVRDLSVKSGVMVEYSYSGEDTEIDRNMVEEISSPLVHMIRNSVDHGIEKPEERLKAGKPECGRIQISASHEGGNVIIKIEDDGRGLNREKILEKARSVGIIRHGEDLTDREAFQLIFNAGFSTAEKVTDISGRGVGMDVVRQNIEKLRGRIEIDSAPGEGTVFSIYLPLTLAIIEGMAINVSDTRYIIPTVSIIEALRPKKEQVKTVVGKGEMINLRGQLMPLFRLSGLFGKNGVESNLEDSLAVVVTGDGKKCALLVDELIGKQQVVIKPLGKMFRHLDYVSGGAIMGDGKVSLIIDTTGITRLANSVL